MTTFKVKSLMVQAPVSAHRNTDARVTSALGALLRQFTIAAGGDDGGGDGPGCGCTCSCTATGGGGDGCGCTCTCTCTGSSGDIGSLGRPGDLEVLKDALRKALAQVERHEETLKPQTIEEVDALERHVREALQELKAREAELKKAGGA